MLNTKRAAGMAGQQGWVVLLPLCKLVFATGIEASVMLAINTPG
jgi:hypothetical protein